MVIFTRNQLSIPNRCRVTPEAAAYFLQLFMRGLQRTDPLTASVGSGWDQGLLWSWEHVPQAPLQHAVGCSLALGQHALWRSTVLRKLL